MFTLTLGQGRAANDCASWGTEGVGGYYSRANRSRTMCIHTGILCIICNNMLLCLRLGLVWVWKTQTQQALLYQNSQYVLRYRSCILIRTLCIVCDNMLLCLCPIVCLENTHIQQVCRLLRDPLRCRSNLLTTCCLFSSNKSDGRWY